MNRETGLPVGVGYDLLPIGTAEIIARDDDSSEFGIGEGCPNFTTKTPQCERIIGVGRF